MACDSGSDRAWRREQSVPRYLPTQFARRTLRLCSTDTGSPCSVHCDRFNSVELMEYSQYIDSFLSANDFTR